MSIVTTGGIKVHKPGRPQGVDPAAVDMVMQLIVSRRMVVVVDGEPALATSVVLSPDPDGVDFVVLNVESMPE